MRQCGWSSQTSCGEKEARSKKAQTVWYRFYEVQDQSKLILVTCHENGDLWRGVLTGISLRWQKCSSGHTPCKKSSSWTLKIRSFYCMEIKPQILKTSEIHSWCHLTWINIFQPTKLSQPPSSLLEINFSSLGDCWLLSQTMNSQLLMGPSDGCWMDERISGWRNGWMDRWVDEWIGGGIWPVSMRLCDQMMDLS